ncbi:(2Fe-2S)-binding protein [Burkholderia sp. Ac-20344]|uniref:(2Fe-2S)-binding protein n=1 Tax=Burkholderia sp. Ac-20344 TaxID=2703890 RepID=UPI00197B8237|nr:(2Fe-2S)-binding protein [Burkholderia sp. Ac-20344]MBN3830344.1 (2Fe-2S)-binding protein [Burkholderia sp. Ac-20344]
MRNEIADQAATVNFFFDKRSIAARAGECIAAALFAAGVKTLRKSPRLHQPRGMFCLMGSCQECLVMVDGQRLLACRTPVTAALQVGSVPEIDAHE